MAADKTEYLAHGFGSRTIGYLRSLPVVTQAGPPETVSVGWLPAVRFIPPETVSGGLPQSVD